MCESSLSDALTRQFYAWEVRGRGWHVFPQPVTLEPPFRPFYGHYASYEGVARDDGQRPTAISTLFDRLKSRRAPSLCEVPDEREPEPVAFNTVDSIIEMHVAIPADLKVTKDAASQFLLSVGHVACPISFEILGTSEAVVVVIACAKGERQQIREQMHAYFPDAMLVERNGYLASLWNENGGCETAVVDFGLSREFMRPLRSYDRFEPDPLSGIIGAMSDLAMGEVALLQVLFSPVRHPWAESIMRAVTDAEGDCFFADDPAMLQLAAEKTSSPLFAAVLRVAAQSPRAKRAWRITQGIAQALRQFGNALSNELIPLSNDDYDDDQHSRDVVARASCRSGMLVNCSELLSLVHPPSASARSPKLKRDERRTKLAPQLVYGHELVLGLNHHAGKTIPVTLGREQRVRHMHLVGASGSGKSTLLLNMIVQDIAHGEGIAVLDPHGDLIEEIVTRIPEARTRDVVFFDPSDEAYPVGFNILSAHSELERNLLASDLVSVFRRLSTSFGDQMNTVLANAILAFLENQEPGTLIDLRRFLVEPAFREKVLATVTDPEITYYWQREFPLLSGKPQGPILTRLDTFLRPKVIRHMVAQKVDRLNFADLMGRRKILLAKLSQGLIGEENSYLLGTLLVSKISQTAMSRQSMAASSRVPFYLYIDEFHNFVTPSLAGILVGARKYQLGLVLAHQELHQITSRDAEVASAVLANPHTRVCFRLGDADAKKLEDGFATFAAKDLQNLGIGEAICRVERAEYDFNLKTVPLEAVDPVVGALRREAVLSASREQYARTRDEVEAAIQMARNDAAETIPPRSKEKIRLRVPLPGEEVPHAPQGKSRVAENALPGRGGEHHTYLQQLIKRWAENRGFSVVIEQPILDGLGSVDVALEKASQRIACEVSVTTDSEHEVQNVQKCLAAGFDTVILVSSEKKVLAAARHALVAALSSSQFRQVQFLAPEEAFSFLETVDITNKVAPEAARYADPQELMTAKEVEELLRIDVKTVYSYAQRGLLPYVKIQSNLRFIRSEVLKWMEEHQYKPPSKAPRR